jgi:hypothetical protein
MKMTVKKPFTHGSKELAKGDTVNISIKEAEVYTKMGLIEAEKEEVKTTSKTNKNK